MAKIKLDIIEGSNLITLKNGGSRDTRVAFVYEIDNSVPEAVKSLALRVGGMPARGEPHPVESNLFVVGYDVRPTDDPTACFVLIIYESTPIDGGGPGLERLAVRDTTTIAQVTTQRIKGGGDILKVYAGQDTSTGTPRVATMSYPMPMRNRVLYGLFNKPRPDEWRDCVNKVNDGSFEGLPLGYWLCSFYDEAWSDLDRQFRVTLGFTSMVEEDWSNYWFMRGPDGDVADVDETIFQSLVTQGYQQGIVNQTDGIMKVGFYGTVDFDDIFTGLIDRVPRTA